MNIECYWQSENAVSKKSCDLAGGASFPVDLLRCRCYNHNKIIEYKDKNFGFYLGRYHLLVSLGNEYFIKEQL